MGDVLDCAKCECGARLGWEMSSEHGAWLGEVGEKCARLF